MLEQQLVIEFRSTSSPEAKEQVIANLANFAYDPVNYDHFKRLNIMHLFLDQLEDSSSETIREFAVGGICNLAADPNSLSDLINHGGVQKVIGCLSSPREETVLSAMTIMIFIAAAGGDGTEDVTSRPALNCMLQYADSANKRLSNLAKVFLEDACTTEQISAIKSTPSDVAQNPE